MNFGQALEIIKNGGKGWNGNGMLLFLSHDPLAEDWEKV